VRGLAALVLASAAVGATGCATAERANDRVNPEVPLWYSHRSGAMHITLRRPLTAGPRVVGEEYERGRPEIDPLGGRVFVGSSDHGLYALRAGGGSTIWRFETLGIVQSEPLYDSETDQVYFGSHDGALYAVRASDGKLAWRFNAGAEVAKRPVRVGETLYVANGADQLFALDRHTGKQRWTVHRTSALGMEVAGYAGPTYDSGKIYMAYSDGNVAAYDARDGSEKWTPVDLAADAEHAAGGEAPRYLDVDTTPVVDDGPSASARVVYVASYAGGVVALDAETGGRVWTNDKATGVTDLVLWREPAHEASPHGPYAGGPMVPERKVLLASSASSGLWGLDPASGRMLWRNKVPEGGIGAPVPVAGAIMVSTTRYGMFLMSPVNGRVIDAFDVGTGFAQTPAVFGHRAYALSNGGTFVGIHVEPPVVRTPLPM
jgi:outer membrane protein assembly factor BamB